MCASPLAASATRRQILAAMATTDKEFGEASTVVTVSPQSDWNTASLSAAEEKIVSPMDDEKQVLRPMDDTDKQVLSHGDDSEKQVVQPIPADEDTNKIFVPQPPPMSMEKEVAAPGGGDLQVVTPSDRRDDRFPLLQRELTADTKGRKLFAGFRLEKKHAYGLIWYTNQTIACRMVDLQTGDIGPAAFVTSSMAFTEAMLALPPTFDLLVPNGQVLVSRFTPGGMQGLVSMKGEIEAIKPGSGGALEKFSIKRKGLMVGGRQYDVAKMYANEPGFVWKGSTRVVKEVYSAAGAKESVKHGSLKLVDEAGEVLAVWNQWRDTETLGDLMIFDTVMGKISVEVVVTSAIAVIHAERVTGMNWVGGIGK